MWASMHSRVANYVPNCCRLLRTWGDPKMPEKGNAQRKHWSFTLYIPAWTGCSRQQPEIYGTGLERNPLVQSDYAVMSNYMKNYSSAAKLESDVEFWRFLLKASCFGPTAVNHVEWMVLIHTQAAGGCGE